MSNPSFLATFDAAPQPDGEWVVRKGKIFEVGSWPDKDYAMTAEELALAAAEFAPVPIDLEHRPTVLDGHLGELRSVELSPDGKELHGSVALPTWLDKLLGDGSRKVSCDWHRPTKRLQRLALVVRPRISDASLFASFAEAHPEQASAVFATPRKTDAQASATLQVIHDLTAMHDGICGGKPGVRGPASFADRPKQLKALKSIHDASAEHGATCGSAGFSHHQPSPKGKTMSWIQTLKTTLFGGTAAEMEVNPTITEDQAKAAFSALMGGEAPKGKEAAPPPATPANFAESAEFKAAVDAAVDAKTKAERDRLDKLQADFRNKEIGLAAAAFAEGEITNERSHRTEAEFADLVYEYTRAALDDDKDPIEVTFSDAEGKEVKGGRVARLIARHARKPRLALYGEKLGHGELPPSARIVFNAQPKSEGLSESRRNEILANTPTGQAALAKLNGNGKA